MSSGLRPRGVSTRSPPKVDNNSFEKQFSWAHAALNRLGGDVSLDTGLSSLLNASPSSPVHRLLRWLRRQRSNTCGTRDATHSQPIPPENKTSAPGLAQLLPCHLPEIPFMRRAKSGRPVAASRRQRQRHRINLMAWEWLEMLIAHFNYIALDCPKDCTVYSDKLGAWHISTRQHTFILLLFEQLGFFAA